MREIHAAYARARRKCTTRRSHAGLTRDRGLPADVFDAARRLAAAPALRDYFSRRYLETYAHLIHGQHEALLSELTTREYDFFF